MLLDMARGFRQLVFPGICVRCEALVADPAADFCPGCCHILTDDPHSTCPRCSSTVGDFTDVANGCPRCRDERYHFDSVIRLGPYDGMLRDSILSMKHLAGENLAEAMGRLFVQHHEARFRALGVQVVIPIPLHWWRQFRRGYNQAASLSGLIAQLLDVPLRTGWLRRTRATKSQAQLSKTDRRTNLIGAFRCAFGAHLNGRTVLLVDDVLTTGSTASEAAKTLKEAGALKVHVAVLAHR